ncbi:MAG TPA: GAF domain-containing sensor histidine kinase [Roseiflexaceae bacterium]|nr:GAF domain-containing sensor histidine kinase [Roseiflexaceae bacterium]
MGDETTLVGTDRRARLIGVVLINGGLLLLLLGLYYGLAGVLLPLVGVRETTAHALATLCVAVVVVPVRQRVVALSNRIIHREWQGTQDLLREVGAALSRTIDPAALYALLVEDLPHRLRIEGATLWMLEPPDDHAFTAIGRDPAEPGATLLANGASVTQVRYAPAYLRVPALAEIEWAPPLIAQGVRLAIPLRVGDRLVGIYGCGAPIGRRSYPPHVLNVLLTLAPSVASSIENARAYTEIARLNAQLRALDQLKDEFIASVGHELRTPLTSLTLALQLLAHQPDLADDLSHVLRRSVARLQALVERVLRLDQQHRGQEEHALALTSVELLPLLEDIAAEYAPSANAKGLRLAVDVPEGLAVWGEGASLRRALHEIVDNAVRYSERGTVALSAAVQDGVALVSVSDQGPGIPPEERDWLFDAFYRGRGARALAEQPGAGLGLSLARRDLEALGGHIWLQHTGPEGSTMCVSLPAVILSHNELGAPSADLPAHPAPPPPLPERVAYARRGVAPS